MTAPADLLFGRVALREKMVTREQLFDCLAAKERNPGTPLGEVMIRRRVLTAAQVRNLLELQTALIQEARRTESHVQNPVLLGRLLIEQGLCTDLQVHECLRLRGRMEEMGIQPVPSLQEVLIRRGYLSREALAAASQYDTLSLYRCPECGAPLAGEAKGPEYACPRCRARLPSFLAMMAGSVAGAISEATDEHDIDLPAEVRQAARDPDRRFGRYVLVKEVGRGGSGVVWKAWQRDRNRIVALKMLSHDSETAAGVKTPFGDAEDLRRFYNEGRAVAELRHPNIVAIHDFEALDKTFYFTMDFVEGVTLDDLVRTGRTARSTTERALEEATAEMDRGRAAPPSDSTEPKLELREALRIMRDVARGVHYAHEKGVYHRDIKPSNIIVTPDGRPMITDFGLAKVVCIGDAAYVKGVIMGTPYYMPPEQAEGDMEKVDHLSDVYSLGAVTYEAATGISPFGDRSPDTVIDMLPKSRPQPVQDLRGNLPPEVAAIITKAMQKEKGRRYPSAAAFADDLDRFLEGRSLAPEPGGAGTGEGLIGSIKKIFR